MDWQPIETAPRDGTAVLAYIPCQTGSGLVWDEMHVIWCDDETGQIDNHCDCGWDIDDFTHWMPLPPAPEREA